MRILLTGASGFIGSRFLRLALSEGHEVAGLTRGETAKHQPLVTRHPSPPVTWLKGNLEDPPWKEIDAFRPEACVHCAWSTAPTFSYESPGHLTYVEWSRAFLQRLLDMGVQYIIGLGTCLEYRIGPEPLVEEVTPLAPLGPYAESKNAMRAWLEEEAHRQNFRYCWGRGFYVYGPGEDPTRLCSSVLKKLRQNEPVVLNTPQSTKDYIYIDDIVSALFFLFQKQAEGVFNIGSGIGVSVWELAQTFARMLGKPELVIKADKEKPDPLGYVVADISKIRRLGWQPQYDLARGLQSFIAAHP